ncbi:T9SS type A sorting domain-containing protein [Dyadobacter sp. CY326]|uniref:T9SS type A sorting domain-containing protein n=1 Tax=Dyadobacter sp. CY326 TaxID=2907300 RepID=UPI001F2916CE|nr:T9SS type A sorting domain-containing protein [Dyadobacter sp. CY326]MCE7065148.1 T9SS type A sorting domain-containing protein [Dyadobacter sp. CY326]
MKTCTLVFCFMLFRLCSYAANEGSYADKPIDVVSVKDHKDLSEKAEPFSLCLEAENALGNGPVTEDPNASNGKTRGDKDNWDHYVDYDINGVLASGEHQLIIRYYTAGDANVSVSVNGTTAPITVELPATHSWNIVWAEKTISINLNKGANRVRIQGLSGYSVRQDRICVTGSSGPSGPVTCNFDVFPWASSAEVLPGQAVTLDANCSGSDCGDVSFNWTGNGVDLSGAQVTFNAPATPGSYAYELTASKNGCIAKMSRAFVVVDDTPTCDFAVSSFSPNYFASCATQVALIAECSGGDCWAIKYNWSGNGATGSGSTVTAPAPSANGRFYYTVTASKNGCPDKSSNAEVLVRDCPITPAEPFSACVEAENSAGNGPVTSDPNASGGMTRGAENNWDHYVEYEVNGVKATGPHELTLRYYAAQDAAVDVIVNGGTKIPVVGLNATHTWNIVSGERTITVNLVEGNNKIRIIGLPGYSPVRQDRICVTGSGGTGNPPTCDFQISANAVTISPSCRDAVAIYALCSGGDCESVNYQWTGNDINLPGRIVYLDPPGKNGTFTYIVTASKNACLPKTATVAFTVTGCEPAGEPYTACVEAENSASNGLVSDDPNASNGQTRGMEGNYDYYVEYAVNNVPASGFYPVTLRYYAAADAHVSVTINGVLSIPSLPLAATHSWNIVSREETFYITLFKGNNTILIQGLPGAACRQDKFCVLPAVSTVRMAAPDAAEMQTDGPVLQAYPNPATSEFNAEFYLQTGKAATLRVMDVQGKVWHQRQVKGQGKNQEHIILSNVPAGIYLLQVNKPDATETKKILIVR